MHKHTTDWFREVHLVSDSATAEKRWNVATSVSKTLTRNRIINVLRLFLFADQATDFAKEFTDELVGIDPEFPVKGNGQELGLMAGLVIASTIERQSPESNAFALGIRCVNFPLGRANPTQPEITAESEGYLEKEINRRRPRDFTNDGSQILNSLEANAKAVSDAAESEGASEASAAEAEFRLSVVTAIRESHRQMAVRTEQLAEEVSLLWWVFDEYSEILVKPTSELRQEEYALISAAEAAERTYILPAPPSIGALLRRASQNCKIGKKKLVLSDYLEATNATWRGAFVKRVEIADCRDLVPICTALEKTEELGDPLAAVKTLPKLCPGVPPDLPVSSDQIARQLYAEIMFLRGIAKTKAK